MFDPTIANSPDDGLILPMTEVKRAALYHINNNTSHSWLQVLTLDFFKTVNFLINSIIINNGRTKLKKNEIFVGFSDEEGEAFAYRCLNDISARQSRKIEPLFPKT